MSIQTQRKIVAINSARHGKVRRDLSARQKNMENADRGPEYWALQMTRIAESRDQTAFQNIFSFYGPRVKSFIMRSGINPGLAEEISQETMLTVWHKAEKFNPALASASTWIYTIARNKKIDRLRKDSKPLPDANDPTFSQGSEINPESVVWHSINSDKVHRALRQLPEDQRRVLTMAFIEDNPHIKISEALGLPLGTVKSRIRLGMGKLRTLLAEQRGDFS